EHAVRKWSLTIEYEHAVRGRAYRSSMDALSELVCCLRMGKFSENEHAVRKWSPMIEYEHAVRGWAYRSRIDALSESFACCLRIGVGAIMMTGLRGFQNNASIFIALLAG